MLFNQRGSVLLSAIAVVFAIAVVSGTIASQLVSTNELSQLPRIRATMSQVELKVRALAFSPQAYTGCDSTSNLPANGCVPRAADFTSLSNGLVRVEYIGFDPSVLRVDIRISHNAGANWRGTPINPRNLNIFIPAEILQSQTFQCPTARPIFTAFNRQGNPICSPLPTQVCPPGQYVAAVDPNTLSPICRPAGPGTPVGCPTTQYISQFRWTGDSNGVTLSCDNRKDPFDYYNYTPTPVISATTTRDADTPNPTPSHPTAPTSVTWVSPATAPASSCAAPSPTPTPPCVVDGANLGGYVCPGPSACATTVGSDSRCCSGVSTKYGVPVGEQGDIDCGNKAPSPTPTPSGCTLAAGRPGGDYDGAVGSACGASICKGLSWYNKGYSSCPSSAGPGVYSSDGACIVIEFFGGTCSTSNHCEVTVYDCEGTAPTPTPAPTVCYGLGYPLVWGAGDDSCWVEHGPKELYDGDQVEFYGQCKDGMSGAQTLPMPDTGTGGGNSYIFKCDLVNGVPKITVIEQTCGC